MKILSLIPARSGSKGIKNKNIKLLNNKPLLSYSIEQSLNSKLINRTIVSTDSIEYSKIASHYGAETPYLRPSNISGDLSTDLETFSHALNWLKEKENYVPDICVHLRPTHPFRNIEDIDKMIKMIISDPNIDSVRSISEATETPYKMWRVENENSLIPLLKEIKESYNMPRQSLPKIYYQNACIEVIRTETIINKKSMTGDNIKGYIMNYNYDIDTEEDFIRTENVLKFKEIISGNKKKVFCFDIDGVIANIVENLDYSQSTPNNKIIKIINRLYERGNKIILFTARGYVSKINWEETTKKQMKKWGLKYTELIFGKPAADFYIDDKMLSLTDLVNLSIF